MADKAHIESDEIVVDTWDDEDDSGYVSGFSSYADSIKSSIFKYHYENGRRYQAYREDQISFPNDEDEQKRLDMLHHIFLLSLGGDLYRAPLEKDNLEHILDLGTGTGIWAIDIADYIPNANVLGNDLSHIQPPWVPSNLRFEVDDIEADWQHAPNSYDYIHARCLAGFIKDWQKLYKQSFQALKPGGWIEFQDLAPPFECDDGSIPEGSTLWHWSNNWKVGADMHGVRWADVPSNFKKEVRDAGFVDVEEIVIKIPIGVWPKDKKLKELGAYTQQHYVEGAEGIAMAMYTKVLGWSKEEVHKFVEEVTAEFVNPKRHGYVRFYVVYGRKPLQDESRG